MAASAVFLFSMPIPSGRLSRKILLRVKTKVGVFALSLPTVPSATLIEVIRNKQGDKMTKYIAAASVAIGVMFSMSAQAAPASPSSVQARIKSGELVQKVHHCRRWSGGWGCRWRGW
jgi:hypothetical protein